MEKKLTHFLYPIILTISLGFMSYVAHKQLSILINLGWSFQYGMLIISLAGVVVLLLLCVLGWNLILKVLGAVISYKAALSIWALSFPARYIPGGIWAYTSRASLSSSYGVELSTAITSMYVETLLIILSSITVGIISLIWISHLPVTIEIVLFSWLASLILVHPKILIRLLEIRARKECLTKNLILLNKKSILKLFFYYIFYWGLCSIFFLFFVLSIYPVSHNDWLPVALSFPLCYFMGFIIFFVPSGIGIRESALYMMLSSLLPDNINLLVSLGSRLWLMGGEILFLFLVFIIKKLAKN